METPCSRCDGSLLSSERFCPACGLDHRWVERPERVLRRVPRGLSVQHFQVAADRSATRALAAAAPVQALVRYYQRRIAEPEYRSKLLGTAVRASERQWPRLHRLARYCERVLHMAPVEVYVSTSEQSQAFTFGSGETDVIVITSSMLDLHTDDGQLLFLLGQQLGHVKADHVIYLAMARAFGTALKGIPALGASLSSAANFLLVPWQRTAALTADRAGLLCCQDLATAARLVARSVLGYGPSINELQLGEFVAQAHSLRVSGEWGDTWSATPAFARRLHNLEQFRDSPEWDRIFEASWDPASPFFSCYYCPSGGAPQDETTHLDTLQCEDCNRSLHVDEVPCRKCGTPIAVLPGQSLKDLTCKPCDVPFIQEGVLYGRKETKHPAVRSMSAYEALKVHPSAQPAKLRRSLRKHLEGLKSRVAGVGGEDPVPQKIRVYSAFKRLINPSGRADHDQSLLHARELVALKKLPEPPVKCIACTAYTRDEYCGCCGAFQGHNELEASSLFTALKDDLKRLAANDRGRIFEDPQGLFPLAFHAPGKSLLFRKCPDLDRPGSIREFLRSPQTLAPALRPSNQSRIYGISDGNVDFELLQRLLQTTQSNLEKIPLFILRRGKGNDLEITACTKEGLSKRDLTFYEWLKEEFPPLSLEG